MGDELQAPSDRGDPPAGVSADLPYELQFRILEQLTNIGFGGAGLTITLVGGLLKNSGFLVWLAAGEFALAAILAIGAQGSMVTHLFDGKNLLKRARITAAVSTVLLGMGIGSLATNVLLDPGAGKPPAAAEPGR